MNQQAFDTLVAHGVKLANEMLAQHRQELNTLCQEANKAFTSARKTNGYIFAVDDISNIVITCPACNLNKNNKLPHEFFEGGRLL